MSFLSLSNSQKKSFRIAYNKFKDNYHEYGIQNGREIPCKRVKEPNNGYNIDGDTYFPYQIAKIMEFIDNDEDVPKQDANGHKIEFDHVCCGYKRESKATRQRIRNIDENQKRPACIVPDHMELKTHKENCSRRICHLNLKKYVASKQPNRHTKQEDKLKAGAIYINDIPEQIRKTGLITKKQQKMANKPKRKYGQKVRRSLRLKEKNSTNIYEINCIHEDRPCFLNYKRINK